MQLYLPLLFRSGSSVCLSGVGLFCFPNVSLWFKRAMSNSHARLSMTFTACLMPALNVIKVFKDRLKGNKVDRSAGGKLV